jgi:hypothetical protein
LPVGHSQRAIDELRSKADQHEDQKCRRVGENVGENAGLQPCSSADLPEPPRLRKARRLSE